MIHVISNASKWIGEAPDAIDALFALLAREPLDPAFKHYGIFHHERTEH